MKSEKSKIGDLLLEANCILLEARNKAVIDGYKITGMAIESLSYHVYLVSQKLVQLSDREQNKEVQ